MTEDGFWSEPTSSGVPQSSAWKDFGHTFGYAPTEDGEFERWMDAHKPDWIVATANIELWRAIWEAAREHYGGAGMTDITRRDFLKLFAATTAALALPISVATQTLHLDVEVDEDRLKEAMIIKVGNGHATVTLDQGKMWQAVSATDQHGRVWTTPDGKAWSCGADSFTLEGEA